jgi:hypothetical protein
MDARHSNPTTKLATLALLKQTDGAGNYVNDLANIGSIDATGTVPTVTGGTATPEQNKAHLTSHWFGGDGGGPPGPPTGWWTGWSGKPANVLRELLIRAIEASLGLNHGQDATPANITRELPIDYYWICGLPRFEGYVCWNSAQVTVILLTPGFEAPDLQLDVEDFGPDSDAALDPWIHNPSGILFVGQNEAGTSIDSSGKSVAVMADDVIVHHMGFDRGGVGPWP